MTPLVRWNDLVISQDCTLEQACAIFDQTGAEQVIAVDAAGRPQGLLTDAAVREHLLGGGHLDLPISVLANRNFHRDRIGTQTWKGFHEAPDQKENLVVLVDNFDRVIGLRRRPSAGLLNPDTTVVLMVGGAGTRLRPLTDNCPKPLLPIKNKPLLERTIEKLRALGFRKIRLAVGHKAEQIMNHFRDGARWGVDIAYVHEKERLGTCGALRLLPERPTDSFLVMNGDLITDVRFDALVRFHRSRGAGATVCVHQYNINVPYGVVECSGSDMTGFKEKPQKRYWISAGMYVLEPQAIDLIPPGQQYDMPDLLQAVAARQAKVSVYAVRERWIDIGCIEEYERANSEPEPNEASSIAGFAAPLFSRMNSAPR